MQFQADILDVPIDRPRCVETTALGAAYLAGLAVGVFADTAAVARAHHLDKSFEPRMDGASRQAHLNRWRDAVRRTRSQPGAP
jgi:glycerol kinase